MRTGLRELAMDAEVPTVQQQQQREATAPLGIRGEGPARTRGWDRGPNLHGHLVSGQVSHYLRPTVIKSEAAWEKPSLEVDLPGQEVCVCESRQDSHSRSDPPVTELPQPSCCGRCGGGWGGQNPLCPGSSGNGGSRLGGH